MVLGQLARVPGTIPRAEIEAVVTAFAATYATGDVAGRAALCAPDIRFEDPAGIVLAQTREDLTAMWDGLVARGLALELVPERVIVVGDEALALAHMEIRPPDAEPGRLFLALHFTFDADWAIARLRTFFDASGLG
jgi:ketosteroid isomerase-like protein